MFDALDVSEPERSPDASDEGGVWSRTEVLLLISLYEKYSNDFNNRKFQKKAIWKKISDEMK